MVIFTCLECHTVSRIRVDLPTLAGPSRIDEALSVCCVAPMSVELDAEAAE